MPTARTRPGRRSRSSSRSASPSRSPEARRRSTSTRPRRAPRRTPPAPAAHTLTFDYTVQAGDTSVSARRRGRERHPPERRDDPRHAAANDAVTTVATGSGTAGALANAKNIVIDTTAPTVTDVTSTTANGSYKAGDTVHDPGRLLRARHRDRHPAARAQHRRRPSTTSPARAASTLTFDYTVQSGDTASPLDVHGHRLARPCGRDDP